MYISTSINCVTNLKEILFNAEVNGDGGSTPGYIRTLTVAIIPKFFLYVSVYVGVSLLVLFGGVIIYMISKHIFN